MISPHQSPNIVNPVLVGKPPKGGSEMSRQMARRKHLQTFHHTRRATRFSDDLENEYRAHRQTLPADSLSKRNYSLTSYDLEVAAVREVYIPTDGEKRRALRRTMLSSRTAAKMTTEDIKNQNNYFDAVIFIVTVFLIGMSSAVEQFALKSDPLGPRFILRMPYVAQYALSVILSLMGCLIWHEAKDIRDLLSPIGWLENMPVVLSSVIGDTLGLSLQRQIDPVLYKVMNQSKLLITVLAARAICQQSVSKTQWFAMIGVTGSILMYVGLTPPKPKSADSIETAGDFSRTVVLIILSFGCNVASVVGGIISERLVKRNERPLLVVIGRNRMTGLLTSLALLAVELPFSGQWNLFPFGGFHKGVWLMVCVDLLRCWFVIAVVSRLNSIFKSLAISFAMLVTYISSCTILPASFNPPKFDLACLATVTAMALLGIAYASSRQDSVTIYELERDMRNTDLVRANSSDDEVRNGDSSIEDRHGEEPTSDSRSSSSSSSVIESEQQIESDLSSTEFR